MCRPEPSVKIWHSHERGHVVIPLTLDLPSELSLHIICSGIRATDRFVEYLRRQGTADSCRAGRFLDSFSSAIADALDLTRQDLSVRPRKRWSSDWDRPSPSWLMLKKFIENLSQDEVFRLVIEKHALDLPGYIQIRQSSA